MMGSRSMGGGDDGSEILGEKRYRRRGEHAGEDRGAARRDDPACERLLELGPRGARVSSHEDAPASAPERRRLPEPLDEVGRQILADDPANSVRSEVAARHAARR